MSDYTLDSPESYESAADVADEVAAKAEALAESDPAQADYWTRTAQGSRAHAKALRDTARDTRRERDRQWAVQEARRHSRGVVQRALAACVVGVQGTAVAP